MFGVPNCVVHHGLTNERNSPICAPTQLVQLDMVQLFDHRAVTHWMRLRFKKMVNILHIDGCLTKDVEFALQQLQVVRIVHNLEYGGVGKGWSLSDHVM